MTAEPVNDPIDAAIRIITGDDEIAKVAMYVDDVEVSWALVKWFDLRFGASVIRVGGIGGVETAAAFRNRGYARRLLDATVRFVERSDAPLLTLFGIPGFYHRFGFLPLGPDYMLQVRDSATLPQPDPAHIARPAQEADLPAIRAIWAGESPGLTGRVIRADDQDSWVQLRKSITGGRNDCRVVTDASGAVLGYAWLVQHHWYMGGFREDGKNNLDIGEAGAISPVGADAVLAMLPAWRDEREARDIVLALPPRQHSVGRASQLCDVTAEAEFHANESYMGRTVGSDDLLRQLVPEFHNRWQAAAPDWRGTIDFAIGEERTRLQFDDGVSVVDAAGVADCTITLSPGECARLVFGAFDPDDLLWRSGADERTREVGGILFPQGETYIEPADRF